MARKANHLIEFFGEACPHCEVMKPVIENLERELGVEIDKKEVWQNKKNHNIMQSYAHILDEVCGGVAAVPTFLNTKTNQALCGEQTIDNLRLWASDGKCIDNICQAHSKR